MRVRYDNGVNFTQRQMQYVKVWECVAVSRNIYAAVKQCLCVRRFQENAAPADLFEAAKRNHPAPVPWALVYVCINLFRGFLEDFFPFGAVLVQLVSYALEYVGGLCRRPDYVRRPACF